jgi:hypothetical protein
MLIFMHLPSCVQVKLRVEGSNGCLLMGFLQPIDG